MNETTQTAVENMRKAWLELPVTDRVSYLGMLTELCEDAERMLDSDEAEPADSARLAFCTAQIAVLKGFAEEATENANT